jgi:hypothetical protein
MIDPTKPTSGTAFTSDVRANFSAAKQEIESLQVSGAGGGGVQKIDHSGYIIMGGQAQALMPANPNRRGWSFQNKSLSDMYFNDLGTAADPALANSVYLPPGAYYESEIGGASVAAISLYGSQTFANFVAKEW